MELSTNEVETECLGRRVVELRGATVADVAQLVGNRAALAGAYVLCKVPAEDLVLSHALEDAGFRLLECQLRLSYRLKRSYDLSPFPFVFEEVRDQSSLQDVLAIAAATFTSDRFRLDPVIPPEAAVRRYETYIRNSMQRPDEFVYVLRERQSGQALGFKTHRLISATEALFLLNGVKPEFKRTGVAGALEYFEFATLRQRGIQRASGHVSAHNAAVINLEMAGLGFKVEQCFSVFRWLP